MMHELGVIHGRFQLLHNDHMKYLLAGKRRCRHLVIGITNPDPTLTRDDSADPARSMSRSNPFSYFQRYGMVRAAMAQQGHGDEISIVPFPINFPELYRYYVPLDAVFFLTIYDDWGRRKKKMFTELGLATEVLWECPREEKGLSSTEIRSKIIAGENWQSLVPEPVVRLIMENNWHQVLFQDTGD